jgi:CMP-N-acetylneuraminic acid synthetase
MTVTKKDSAALKHGTLCNDRYVPLGDEKDCFKNRQQLRPVYGPTGAVYVFGADQFLADGGFPSGCIGAVEVPFERSIDIDSEEDLRIAERLSKYND